MFEEISYFPSLTTKAGELLAYEQSYSPVKDGLMPIFTLTRYGETESFADAAAALVGALEGRRAIVDFDPRPRKVTSLAEAAEQRRRKNLRKIESGGKEGRPRSERELANDAERLRRTESFNANLLDLLDPAVGPQRWLDLTGRFPELIPVLQLSGTEILRLQIQHVRQTGRVAAVRVRVQNPEEVEMAVACAGDIGASAPALVLILDVGNVWGRVDNATVGCAGVLRRIAQAVGQPFGLVTTVVVSTAFPRQPLRNVASVLPIADISLHERLAEEFAIRYGDYGSLPNRTDDTPARGFLPHVDLVTSSSWHVYLYEENRNARKYVDASQDAVRNGQWHNRAECWGSSIIEQVSRGNQVIEGRSFTHPSPWLSVRINQHLAQMVLRRR
jgi:hypothetical protein